jgi:hypothetical protein
LDFPERIYTRDELSMARKAIAEGHKHELVVTGEPVFKELVTKILELIDLTNYGELLRTYIREIHQIDGISQLRETDASIWLNTLITEDSIEAARFVVQKTFQMQAYIEGRAWYILGELPAVRSSVEFLRKLREQLKDSELKARCDREIEEWTVDKVT